MKSLLATLLVVLSITAYSQKLIKDTVYLEWRDAKLNEDLVLTYGDNTVQIIPIGSSYIQLVVEDNIYELYRIGEGQYVSLDVQTVLIKNETK